MNASVSPIQEKITNKISDAEATRVGLIKELSLVESELENTSSQIKVYEKLAEVSFKLEELHKLGAGELFWGDKYSNETELLNHIKGLSTKAKTFNDKIDVIRKNKSDLEIKVEKIAYEIGYLKEDLALEIHKEEDSKNDFVINREFEAHVFRATVMPWDNKGENEKRFKKYLLVAFLYTVLLTLVIPYISIPIPDVEPEVKIPERIAKFIKKNKPKPKPKKQQKVAEKKKPSKEATKKAIKKAQKSGLLAFKNNFADLLSDDKSEAKLGANAKLSKQGTQAKSTARSLVLAQAQTGSGGINSSALSRDVGGAGGKIGSVQFSRVSSAIGTDAADDRPLSSGPGPSRTDEEIQIVFDRYKATLYRIYNRELRKNPTLQGKMVLRITIATNGSVVKCKVESTDLDSALLSKKIVERVKRFNFGAKKGVPKITILYPIDFLPAS